MRRSGPNGQQPTAESFRLVVWCGLVVANSWMWMQAFHELGHVVAAWQTGATVVRIVWRWSTVSQTVVWPNPAPGIVAAAGPVAGCAIPLLLCAVEHVLRNRWRTLRFFAGFCLVANGAYLAVGSDLNASDAGVLFANGIPRPAIILAGLLAMAAGLWIWHRLGPVRSVSRLRVSDRSLMLQASLFAATVILQALSGH